MKCSWWTFPLYQPENRFPFCQSRDWRRLLYLCSCPWQCSYRRARTRQSMHRLRNSIRLDDIKKRFELIFNKIEIKSVPGEASMVLICLPDSMSHILIIASRELDATSEKKTNQGKVKGIYLDYPKNYNFNFNFKFCFCLKGYLIQCCSCQLKWRRAGGPHTCDAAPKSPSATTKSLFCRPQSRWPQSPGSPSRTWTSKRTKCHRRERLPSWLS